MNKSYLAILFTILSISSYAQEAAVVPEPELDFEIDSAVKMPNVNSAAEEDLPLLSKDGKTLFFNRTFHPQNIGGQFAGQDIWMSKHNEDGTWGIPHNHFPTHHNEPLNDEYNNVVVGMSEHADTVYLLNIYHHHHRKYKHHHHHSKTAAGMSYAIWQDTAWSDPHDLQFPSLDFQGKHYGLYMNQTMDVLLVSEDAVGSLGLEDLYVCLKKDGIWGEPVHLNGVNSIGYEISPFLDKDGKTLYFSSDREGGMGNADIYVSKRLDDTWQNWSEPVNLGPRFNSDAFDAYFSLTSDNHALFVSNRGSIAADIYIANIIERKEPVEEPVKEDKLVPLHTLVNVDSLIDMNVLVNLDTTLRIRDLANPDTLLAKDTDIDAFLTEMATRFEDKIHKSKGFKVVDLAKEEVRHLEKEEIEELKMMPHAVNIKFDFNIFTLDEEDRQVLSKVVYLVKKDNDLTITLIGHTCSIGAEGYNEDLSRERAEAAKKYLIDKGITGAKINVKWLGERHPIDTNETEEGRRQNRRVEIDFGRNEAG